MTVGAPPRRTPHYFHAEQYGWPPSRCARDLLHILVGFVVGGVSVRGDAEGRVNLVLQSEDHAELCFRAANAEARIFVCVDQSGWVRAELFVDGALILRGWLDEPYEEKEIWPDDADGLTAPNRDAPGRISKRGAWLQIECARFPGVPATATGFWSVERAD